MEYEEKGDGQHGAAGAPTRLDKATAAIQRGSLCYTKEEVAWRDKMSRLDELMRKAPCITVDVFVASVRAVFGTKASE